MVSASDTQQSGSSSLFAEQGVMIPRLFNLDLPRLRQMGQVWPEQADVSGFHRVLDIASGTGEWAILAAQVYPQVQFVGIERDAQLVESARAQAHTRGVENVSFTVMDPFESLDLPDGAFDLVNARYIVGLLEASTWPRVLQEFVRVSRPGGVIRLTENDLPITSGSAFEKLSAMISRAFFQTKRSFSPDGRLLSVTPMLKRLLQDAGCREVRQAVSAMNFSAGMPAHGELCQDFARTYQLIQPFLISTGVTTQQEIKQVYQEILSEMESERFRATGLSLTVWGTKP
jgi:ubiquinone/menaquinone biosynthesis C-methylase UbiE